MVVAGVVFLGGGVGELGGGGLLSGSVNVLNLGVAEDTRISLC